MLASLITQRERWILWLPVALGMGVVAYFALPAEPPLLLGLMACGACAVVTGLGLRLHARFLPWMIAALMLSLGFTLAQLRTLEATAPRLTQEVGPTWIRGIVEQVERRGTGHRVILRGVSVWKHPAEATPPRVRINVRTKMNGAAPGDHISVRGVLLPPPRPAYPGGYDFSRWMFFAGIGATGYTLGPVEINTPAAEDHLLLKLAALRHGIAERILGHFPEAYQPAGAIAAALVTAERGSIPKQVMENMRHSGLGHLLAISGLHLVLVTATVFFVVRAGFALSERMALRYNIKKMAAVVALVAGFGYLALTGFPVSAQRAYIMVALFFFAILVDRTGTPMRPVAWAALIVLTLQPEMVLGPSFQMSFAAATALVAAFEASPWAKPQGWQRRHVVPRTAFYILGLLLSSLVAGLATSPFAIYHFGHYSPYSIAANLLAIPLASLVVMPSALLAMVLMPLGLEVVGLAPMGLGIHAIISIADTITTLPHAHSVLPSPPPLALGIITLGGIWLCLWRGRLRLLGLAPIVLGLVISQFTTPPDMILDEKGKLFALRAGDGQLVFSSRRAARYARNTWLQHAGQKTAEVSLKELETSHKHLQEHAGVVLQCSEERCDYQARGQQVVLFRLPPSAPEWKNACNNADFVIILAPYRAECDNIPTLDAAALAQYGTHTLWIDESGISTNTVAMEQGKRPWSM